MAIAFSLQCGSHAESRLFLRRKETRPREKTRVFPLTSEPQSARVESRSPIAETRGAIAVRRRAALAAHDCRQIRDRCLFAYALTIGCDCLEGRTNVVSCAILPLFMIKSVREAKTRDLCRFMGD